MTTDRIQYWADYIATITSYLRLTNWHIGLSHAPATEPYQATVEPTFGRCCATVALCREWDDLDPETQRQTLVHELVHLYFYPAENVLTRAREQHGKAWVELMWTMHREQLEYGVDGMADIIAPFLPLPPKVKKAKAA